MVASVYTLRSVVDGNLETLVTEYSSYIELLDEKLKNFESGSELTINAILLRDIRRVENKSDFEDKLMSNILAGNYTKLSVGKKEKVAGSREAFQHFIVA